MTQPSLELQQTEKGGRKREGGLQRTAYTFTDLPETIKIHQKKKNRRGEGNLGMKQVTSDGLWKSPDDVFETDWAGRMLY